MYSSSFSLSENALYAIQVGFSHTNILRSIVHHACLRFPNLASVSGISSQIPSRSKSSVLNKSFPRREGAQKVFVIFGGDTSERQVSLMSGTNVWLNLLGFNDVSIHNQENLQILLFMSSHFNSLIFTKFQENRCGSKNLTKILHLFVLAVSIS